MVVTVVDASAAAEVGTCLTATGVRLAPWTDDHDPACGADCGPDGVVPGEDEADRDRCAPDDACGPQVDLAMPAPTPEPLPRGPLCLDSSPTCDPAPGLPVAHGGASLPGRPSDAAALPKRASGTLPGPGPVTWASRPVDRSVPPPTPPPRGARLRG